MRTANPFTWTRTRVLGIPQKLALARVMDPSRRIALAKVARGE